MQERNIHCRVLCRRTEEKTKEGLQIFKEATNTVESCAPAWRKRSRKVVKKCKNATYSVGSCAAVWRKREKKVCRNTRMLPHKCR